MHVISTTSQIINCIPRSKTLTVTLELRNEQTRETTSKETTGSLNGNYVQYDLDFTALEGSYYSFKLKSGSDLLYYGMLFCTDQTNYDAYKITQGEYTSPTTNNEYVFNE